jgi:hypothetical protein
VRYEIRGMLEACVMHGDSGERGYSGYCLWRTVDASYTGAFVRIDGMYSPGGLYRCCPPGWLRPVSSAAGSWLST